MVLNWIRRALLRFLLSGNCVRMVLEEGAIPPTQGHRGDAGWDLFCNEDTTLQPGCSLDIPTGVRLELPDGIWVRITGRSSTVRKWRLQVQEGIIDNGYTGPLFVHVWNLTDEPVIVPRGTRLAQIIPHTLISLPTWETVTDIASRDGRGSSGFGSTGK